MINSLSQVYATLDTSPVITLDFTGDNFNRLSFVLGNNDITVDGVTYQRSNFQVSLPESNNSGFSDIKIQVCNVNNQVYEHLKEAIDNNIVLSVRLCLRLPDTLSIDWVMSLDIKGLALREDKAEITASANDILNCEFPKLRYNALNFPGLRYIS